jgi:hypothetical protein
MLWLWIVTALPIALVGAMLAYRTTAKLRAAREALQEIAKLPSTQGISYSAARIAREGLV